MPETPLAETATEAISTDTLTDAELEALTAPDAEGETKPVAEAPADEEKPAEETTTEPSSDEPETDEPAPASDEETPKSDIAEDGHAIQPVDPATTDEQPIAEQPSHEEALEQRPLSGHASAEMTGVIDAMPSEAQQHMGQWIKPPEEAEPAEPGQLPTAADLPGTPTDATGIGTQAQEPIASGTQGEAAHAESSDDEGDDAEAGEPAEVETPEGLSEDGTEIELAQDADSDEGEDDDSLFGEPLPQHAPLFEVAGDSLGEMKDAAEAAHRASKSLTGFPLEVLDEAHKLLIVEMRAALRDIVRATERLFTRKG